MCFYEAFSGLNIEHFTKCKVLWNPRSALEFVKVRYVRNAHFMRRSLDGLFSFVLRHASSQHVIGKTNDAMFHCFAFISCVKTEKLNISTGNAS